MRTLSTAILIILNWTGILGQSTVHHLPKPTKEEINNERTDDKGLTYLENNFKKIGERVISKYYDDCLENCSCSWGQQFENGISYNYYSCHEAGYDVTITFQNIDKRELKKLVDNLFGTNESTWDKSKTKYGPKDKGVGCYYEIRQEKGNAVLEYHCGC